MMCLSISANEGKGGFVGSGTNFGTNFANHNLILLKKEQKNKKLQIMHSYKAYQNSHTKVLLSRS